MKNSEEQMKPESEAKQFETLVSNAESLDLNNQIDVSPNNDSISKESLKEKLLKKTREFKDKNKVLAGEAIVKARKLSPHVDKLITHIDHAITYIANKEQVLGRSDVVQLTRSPSVFGIWVMLITFGFFMMWAIIAPLNSATHAAGKIILDSKKRNIQAFESGVIKEIDAREGQFVKKGQVLIVLDDTQTRAKKNQIEIRYLNFLAENNRLSSERDNLDHIEFAKEILDNQDKPEVQTIINNQEKIFKAKQSLYKSKTSFNEQQINQSIERKNAILPQIDSTSKQLEIISQQVKSLEKLAKTGSVGKNALQDGESKKAEIEGRRGSLLGQLAETEYGILVYRDNLNNFINENFEKTLTELKENQARLSETEEELNIIKESLKRTVITSPEDGVVSNFNDVLTIGGIVPQQMVLMEVIPQDDQLVIEAKIPAKDIAPVQIGQNARIRLTAFRSKIVPMLEGKVVSLSADIVLPQNQIDLNASQGQPYYKVRIEIDKDQLQKVNELRGVVLYPGMPVDVNIIVGTRTLMKYLLDPISMTIDRSFRER